MCCRLRGLLRWVFSFYFSKEPRFYSELRAYNPNNIDLTWETVVPAGVVLCEKVEAVSIDDRKTRYKVWNEGDRVVMSSTEEKIRLLHARRTLPWLWIGGDTAYVSQDRTTAVDPFVVSGNRITKELLKDIDPSIVKWNYIDTATFKEVEFPEEGITIK